MLRAMIVDDEQPAREELAELLVGIENLTVVGECSNALEAIAAIHRLQPDVVFLDIQMPRISGLEMTAMLDPAAMPHIVFTTAYDEYAVKAFEQHAFDYLLKPIDGQRLLKTIERLRSTKSVNKNFHLLTDSALKHIPCHGHNRIFLLRLSDVEYLSSELSGVRVIGTDQSGYTQLTLKILEEKRRLPAAIVSICSIWITSAKYSCWTTAARKRSPVQESAFPSAAAILSR